MDLSKDLKDIRFNADLSTFLTVYKQYKNFFLPFAVIAASLILFFIILIPQVQGVISAKATESEEIRKLESLKNSNSNLSLMNEEELTKDLTALNKVLPGTKDFAGIINSISSNAAKSGVSVGNFEFTVGDLNEKEQGVTFPTIQITLSVSGTDKTTVDFVKNLYKSAPIAQINTLKLGSGNTNMKILFYYKALPQVSLDNSLPVVSFSQKDKDLITKSNMWSEAVFEGVPISIDLENFSTDSARINPFQ